jgi:uncharacterized protein Smg (DUF494 family)
VEKGDSKANLAWSIYSMISEFMHKEKRTVVDIETAEGLCDDAGYTRDELMKTIDEYEELDIWSYDTEENRIMMVY